MGIFNISIHAPRMGSDQDANHVLAIRNISIHAPRMGSDREALAQRPNVSHFYPRPPHGERRWRAATGVPWFMHFYPRPPHGERPLAWIVIVVPPSDFYPRPPHGERRTDRVEDGTATEFLSTPPAWGATQDNGVRIAYGKFLSTPPAWGATDQQQQIANQPDNFYPRPPHGERRQYFFAEQSLQGISIHAPRMGSDKTPQRFFDFCKTFLSTPPAWGATKI